MHTTMGPTKILLLAFSLVGANGKLRGAPSSSLPNLHEDVPPHIVSSGNGNDFVNITESTFYQIPESLEKLPSHPTNTKVAGKEDALDDGDKSEKQMIVSTPKQMERKESRGLALSVVSKNNPPSPSRLVHYRRFGIGDQIDREELQLIIRSAPQVEHGRRLFFGKVWKGIKKGVSGIKKGWDSTVGKVVNGVKKIGKKIWKAIPDMGGIKGFLGSAGKSLWKNSIFGFQSDAIASIGDLINGDFGAIGDRIMGRVCDADAGAILSGASGGAWSVFTNHACPSPWAKDVEKIRGATESNKKAIRAVERGLEKTNERVTLNSQRIDRINTVISRHDRDIRNIKSDITSLQREDMRIRREISHINADISNIKSNIANIKTDIRNIKSAIVSIHNEIKRINNDIAVMKSDINDLQEADRQIRLEQIRQAEVDKAHQEELLRQRKVDEIHQEELLRQQQVDELHTQELLRQAEEDERLNAEIMRLKEVDRQLLDNDRTLAQADKQIFETMTKGFDTMSKNLNQTRIDMMVYTDEKFLIQVAAHSNALQQLIARYTLPKEHNFEDVYIEADIGEAATAELGLPGLPIMATFTKIKLAARRSMLQSSLVSSSDATVSDDYHSNFLLMLDSIIASETRLDSIADFISVSEDPIQEFGDVVEFPFIEYDELRTELSLMRYPLVEQTDKINLAHRKRVDASPNWVNPNGCVAGFMYGSVYPSTTLGLDSHYLQIDLGHEEAIELVVLHGTSLLKGEVMVELFDEDKNMIGARKVRREISSASYLYFRDGSSELLGSFSASKNARYVKVSVKDEILLSQIVVYGADRALYREARQSSTSSNFEAYNAVDGAGSSLSTTNGELNPWWELDLLYSYHIGAVLFQSHGCTESDPCSFEVTLLDSSGNVQETKVVADDGSDAVRLIFPQPLSVQILQIQLKTDGARQLSLRQVKVFGPADAPIVNSQRVITLTEAEKEIVNGKEFEPAHSDAAGLCIDALQEHWSGEVKLTNCRGIPTQQWRFDGNHLKLYKISTDFCLAYQAATEELIMAPCDTANDAQNFEYRTYGGLLYFTGAKSWSGNAWLCVGIADILEGNLGLYDCDSRANVMNWNFSKSFTHSKNNLAIGDSLSLGQFISSDQATLNVAIKSNLFEGDTTSKVYPTADLYIRSGIYADTNYGLSPSLVVKNDSGDYNRKAVLRFSNLSSYSSAKLQIYINDVSADASRTVQVSRYSDTIWEENTFSWNDFDPSKIDKISQPFEIIRTDVGKWKSVSIGDLLFEGEESLEEIVLVVEGTFSQSPTSGFAFGSKESGMAPRLITEPVSRRLTGSGGEQNSAIKTELVSAEKDGDIFDDGAHHNGVDKIYLAWGDELDGIRLVYRDGFEGSYHGIENAQIREFSLLEEEHIVTVRARENLYSYGMAFISLTTSLGRVIEMASSKSAENDGIEKIFNAPSGHILGGIHGMTGGVKGSSPITLGVYWVKDSFHNLGGFDKPAIFDRGIRSLQICHNPNGIYSLQIAKYSDGTVDDEIIGLKTSSCRISTIDLDAGDFFNQIDVAECPNMISICSITLHSHILGEIGRYGITDPNAETGKETFAAPQGYAIGGFFGNAGRWLKALGVYFVPLPTIAGPRVSHKTEEFRGSNPSTSDIITFDDGDGIDSERSIETIFIGDGWYIDGIGSRYDDGSVEFHGGLGGEKNRIELDPNEYVTKVIVTESFVPESFGRRKLASQSSLTPLTQGYVELRSSINSDMCLDVKYGGTDDFTRLQLYVCNDTPAQKFFLDSSGKLRSQLKQDFCVEMDPNPDWGGVFMHSACIDEWEILNNGSLRNIGDWKCLTLQSSTAGSGTSIVRDNCSPQSRQIWQSILTNKGNPPSALLGKCEGDCDSDADCGEGLRCFHRVGVKDIPGCTGPGLNNWDYCTNEKYFPPPPTPAPTPSPKYFLNYDFDGDMKTSSKLLSYGPTWQDGGGSISISKNYNELHLMGNAWKSFEFASPFVITENIVLSVTVELIKETEIHAICLDSISNGNSAHVDLHCFQLGGTQAVPGMRQLEEDQTYLEEGDKVTYILPFGKYLSGTTAKYLAFAQDSDSDKTLGKSTFSSVAIWSESVSYLEFRNTANGAMCLTVNGGSTADFTRLKLWECDGTPSQKFFLDSSGKLRSILKSSFCVEMDPNPDWGGVFMHSACIDKWEYRNDGSLWNIGDSMCMTVDESNIGGGNSLIRAECDSSVIPATQTWSTNSFTPEQVGLFIGSLSFETTTGKSYGPYGRVYDNAAAQTFEAPPGHMLGGFYGSRNQYLVGIGFYWVPIPPHSFGFDNNGDLSLWRQSFSGRAAARIWSAERDGLAMASRSIPGSTKNKLSFDGAALVLESEEQDTLSLSKNTILLDDGSKERRLSTLGESTLVSTYSSNNGSWGNMFDVAALRDISIHGVDIHTWSTDQVTVVIYTRSGSFVGNENSSTGWEKILEIVVTGQGEGNPTPVPNFPAVIVSAGSTRGFYVTLNSADLRYTNGNAVGAVISSNSDVEIYEGKGLGGIFGQEGVFQPRIWNGNLRYTTITPIPTGTPSVEPSMDPSFIPTNAPSLVPSTQPTKIPTRAPSNSPSMMPTTSTAPTKPAEVVLTDNGLLLIDDVVIPFAPQRRSFAFFVSMSNNFALDIMTPQRGSPVFMTAKRDDEGKEHQKWRLTSDGYLENSWNGLVLDIVKDSGVGTTALEMKPKSGSPTQKWTLTGDNYLQSLLNGLVLQVKDGSQAEEATLILWSKKDSANQKWFFTVDNCGCSTCTPSRLGPLCTAKIEDLMNSNGVFMSERDACEQVSIEEPFGCGVHCRPSTCIR